MKTLAIAAVAAGTMLATPALTAAQMKPAMQSQAMKAQAATSSAMQGNNMMDMQAKPQADFLKGAVKGDVTEIRYGELAMKNGSTAAVRKFGRTLVTDHSKALGQAMAVARTMNVKTPRTMASDAVSEYNKLKGMSGKAFDTEFLNVAVKDHEKDIAKFSEQAQSAGGPTAKLANKQLPTLRKHLRIAQSLQS